MNLNNDGERMNTIASMFMNGQLPDFKWSTSPINFKNLKPIALPSKETLKAARKATTGNSMGMSSGLQTGLNIGSTFMDSLIPDNLDPSQKAIKSSIKSMTALTGPVGSLINIGDSVLGGIGALTGLQLDNMNKSAANRAGVGGAGVNNTLMSIPILGPLGGFMAGKTDKSYKSAEIDNMRSAYGGSTGDIDAAQSLGDKRFLFGKKKANKFIEKSNYYNEAITGISTENKLRKQSTYGNDLASQNYMKFQGIDPNRMAIGRQGIKFQELDKAKTVLMKFNSEKPKENIIVEGALHARKHNLANVDPNLECVTNKGIPIITHEDGGEIIQHAEVEGGELILTKEITTKLEELYKEDSEDAMIKAGKLLAQQLIESTDDKTATLLDDD